MIEYLYNTIRATAGEDLAVAAIITDEEGNLLQDVCSLMLYSDTEMLFSAPGAIDGDMWVFTIPAKVTEGLNGKYWYCICCGDTKLCFKQPFYLV